LRTPTLSPCAGRAHPAHARGLYRGFLVPSGCSEVDDGLGQGQRILAGLGVLRYNGGAFVFEVALIGVRIEDVGQVVVSPKRRRRNPLNGLSLP
jgi:hypothetical protein